MNALDLPILIYLHDGQFQTGSTQYIDGSILSHVGNMIVVTVQYRLNIFGFLSLDSANETIGNYGLLDQQMAIEFVHQNAGTMGGNSSLITIVGLEAGGSSVGHLLKSKSRSLISGAISMLGVGKFQYPAPDTATLEKKLRQVCEVSFKMNNCDFGNGREFLTRFSQNLTMDSILSLVTFLNARFLPRPDDDSFFTQEPVTYNDSLSYMILTTSVDGPLIQPAASGQSLCSIYEGKFWNILIIFN